VNAGSSLDALAKRVHKVCSKCVRIKPIFEFGPDKRAKDNHKSQCRKCQDEYSKTIAVRQRKREYQKRYAPKNKQAVRARMLFGKAIQHGYIKKPKYISGRNWHNNWEFHHPNYNMPYLGYWLPAPIHRQVHLGKRNPPKKYYKNYTIKVRRAVLKQWFP